MTVKSVVFALVLLAVLFALVPTFAVAEPAIEAPASEAPVLARTVFFTPYLSIYHNRYNANGAYIGKALGGGLCTPTRGSWCKATNAYGKVFFVKWCNYARCVRW